MNPGCGRASLHKHTHTHRHIHTYTHTHTHEQIQGRLWCVYEAYLGTTMEKFCLMPATPHARRQGYSCAKVLLIPFLLGLLTSLLWRYAMYPKYGRHCVFKAGTSPNRSISRIKGIQSGCFRPVLLVPILDEQLETWDHFEFEDFPLKKKIDGAPPQHLLCYTFSPFFLTYTLTVYLVTYMVTFYLTWIQTFYLPFYLISFLTFYLTYILTFYLPFYLTYILTLYLTYILRFYLT